MASYAVGFTPGLYRLRTWRGIRYYVGYDAIAGAAVCRRYTNEQSTRMPFQGGATSSTILAGGQATCPGFDIDADGQLWVDVPTDADGSARRFVSNAAGSTWTEIAT